MITRLQDPYEPVHIKSILHPLINRWFSGKFKEFSLPQLYGVMEIHCRKNILISAPTGSGKTLTAFLSIINELVDSAEKQVLEDKVYCIYVSPLKALGNDIQINLLKPLEEINELAEKKLGIRVAVRTGDTTASEKAKMLKHIPHILITTPESLAILLNSPKFKEKIKDVQWLIIDEIHSLAENKRGVHLSLSVERLQKISPGLTRIGLSATIAPLEEIAKYLVGYNGSGDKNDQEEERDCGIVDVSFIKKMDLKVLSPVRSLVDMDHSQIHQKMYELIDELVQQHRTTLIFTNTRSATERVVHNLKEMFPQHYKDTDDQGSNIAAHHGSLSKQNRFNTEQALRDGKLKVVVSSTSLELGIDIGYVDLVLCLGSPKSVARFLQRSGRSGHKLQDTVKARIIVMDRDDLIECSLLLKSAIEKKIDQVHIPVNALDVLAQQIYGIVINDVTNIYELFHLIKKSYSYHSLPWEDFFSVIRYLSGEYVSLEERHIYARIWYDKESGNIGKRGKMARIIYMTNIGTIPEESYVTVKIGEQIVGKIDEAFLEHLKPGDVFVLGGEVYMFKFSRGMTAQVSASVNRPPTVPSWFSEMLPLSFDLAMEINRFRKLMEEKLRSQEQNKLTGDNQNKEIKVKETEEQIIKFINDYLYVDENAAHSIYRYFYEQYHFSTIPSSKQIVIETYADRGRTYVIFHTLYGRRVNDCLSRALAYIIGRSQHRDVEMGITDNGFYLSAEKTFNATRALDLLKNEDFRVILETAIEKSEVLSRRFRHCATRSLMILRQYLGQKKNTGRMQVGSKILFNAVKRIDNNFPILKEARREVMEDLMDCQHAQEVINQLKDGTITIIEKYTEIPSPFAFSLVSEGYSDVIKIEDRQEFLRRMHQQVLAKIALKEGKKILKENTGALSQTCSNRFSYSEFWEDLNQKKENDQDLFKEKLKLQVWTLKQIPVYAKEELIKLIEFGSMRKDIFDEYKQDQERIKQEWPKELKEFVLGKINSAS
ncbi:MAG: ATP-dependent helicase [Nanoarchaeota archaeon]